MTFKNQDDREHTATSDGDGPIDSGTLGTGDTYRVRFPAAGSYAFLCLIHPEMRGTIKVVDSAGGTGATPSSTPARPTPTPSSPAPSVDPTASPAVGPVAIDIVDFAFDTTSTQVPVGARVTWTNRGQAPHTVTGSDGSFDSGNLAAGATFETTFAAAGEFAYACAIHPDMIGTVTVVSAESPTGGGPTGDAPVSSDRSVAQVANGAVAVPPPSGDPDPTVRRAVDLGPGLDGPRWHGRDRGDHRPRPRGWRALLPRGPRERAADLAARFLYGHASNHEPPAADRRGSLRSQEWW